MSADDREANEPMHGRDGAETTRECRVGGRSFTLVGTAHVSRESVAEVTAAIEQLRPERVCVEIDDNRYRRMMEKHSWENLNIGQVLRQRQGFLLLANLLVSSFQRRLGSDLGTQPGEEMRAAIETAQRLNIPIALCDRDIQITLRRAWRLSGFWGRMKLIAMVISSAFPQEQLSAEQVEQLKQGAVVDNMMHELAEQLPVVKSVLIDERDRYLATRIFQQPEERVLAVIGLGHMRGVIEQLERLGAMEAGEAQEAQPTTGDKTRLAVDGAVAANATTEARTRIGAEQLREIERVPPPHPVSRLLPWLVPAVVIGLIAFGFVRSGWDGGLQSLYRWVLVNGVLSAIGAAMALANPVTIIVAFLAAPLTSINPTIGVGFVTGIVEATMRKPRVVDFEHLRDDIASLRGFFRNRITRILLVFLLSSIGSAIGTFIAIPLLFP